MPAKAADSERFALLTAREEGLPSVAFSSSPGCCNRTGIGCMCTTWAASVAAAAAERPSRAAMHSRKPGRWRRSPRSSKAARRMTATVVVRTATPAVVSSCWRAQHLLSMMPGIGRRMADWRGRTAAALAVAAAAAGTEVLCGHLEGYPVATSAKRDAPVLYIWKGNCMQKPNPKKKLWSRRKVERMDGNARVLCVFFWMLASYLSLAFTVSLAFFQFGALLPKSACSGCAAGMRRMRLQLRFGAREPHRRRRR